MIQNLKLTALIILLVAGVRTSNAQDYNTGIGVRGGLSNGITIKHFLSEKNALEFLVASRWRGYNITGLYEIHNDISGAPGLRWYYGLGGHIGRWKGYSNHPWFPKEEYYTVVGADLILGLEYTFEELPLNLGLDYKPAFNFYGYTGFWGDEGALSIRFVF